MVDNQQFAPTLDEWANYKVDSKVDYDKLYLNLTQHKGIPQTAATYSKLLQLFKF